MSTVNIGSTVLLRNGVQVLITDIESGYYIGNDVDGEGFAFTDIQIQRVID